MMIPQVWLPGVLALLTVTSAALAAPAVMSQAQKAQAHIDLATAYFAEKNFATALEELRVAMPLLAESPAQFPVLFNVARCLEEMHRDSEAIAAYETYLQTADDGPRRERAKAALKVLRARTLGHLRLTCQPTRTALTVSGLGSVPCPFDADVAAGPLTIEGRAAGYQTHRSKVDLVAGGFIERTITLLVETPKGAGAPVSDPAPPSTNSAVATEAAPQTPESRLGPMLVIGGGGLLLVAGGVLHAMAVGAQQDAESKPRGAARTSATDDYETLRAATLGSYAVGALVTGVGLWLFLAPGESPGASAATGGPRGFGFTF